MYQYTILAVYKDDQGTTCQHCGRGIKNVVKVKDNVTGEEMVIGTTCIDKLILANMTESFTKRVAREIKKYMKLDEKVKSFNLENEVTKIYEDLQTIEDRKTDSNNDYKREAFVKKFNDTANKWEYKTNEEFEATKQELIDNLNNWHNGDKKALEKQTEILNTISKNNLFNL